MTIKTGLINVCGLKKKLKCLDFVSTIQEFDILMVCETKLDDMDIPEITNYFDDLGYYVFFQNRQVLSTYRSGGVLIAIRHCLVKYVNLKTTNYDNMIVLDIDKKLHGYEKNLLLICVYVPPHSSRYSNVTLFDRISDVILNYHESDYYYLLGGDLNAHTLEMNDVFHIDESLYDILDLRDDVRELLDTQRMLEILDIPTKRKSVDTKTDGSGYGRALIDICQNHNVIIFNGRLCQDRGHGRATNTEGSVIDYYIGSPFVASKVRDFIIQDFDPLFSDQHCLIEMSLACNSSEKPLYNEAESSEQTDLNSNDQPRFFWDGTKKEIFYGNINQLQIDNLLTSAAELSAQELNHKVNDILISAARGCLKEKSSRPKPPHTQQHLKKIPKMSENCKNIRKEYHRAKQNNNRYKTAESHSNLVTKSKAYKLALKTELRNHEQNLIHEIRTLKSNNPKDYWKLFSRRKTEKVSVSLEELSNHFKNLANENIIEHQQEIPVIDTAVEAMNTETLNNAITEREIMKCIEKLKNGKSPGIDGVLNEFLKVSKHKMIKVYVILFNKVLNDGEIPEEWTKGLIIPLYKNKGDKSNPNNYRGITLLSCTGKLFTAILNERLGKFCNDNNILSDKQAGFRSEHSTVDHIFLMKTLTDIFNYHKKKLYCCYIDFQKAFDSVWRDALWYKAELFGVNGKFMRVIKNLYQNVKSCVYQNGTRSDFFQCSMGVRQGENLSPLLFSLFVNDIEDFLFNSHCTQLDVGWQHVSNMLRLFVLLYADDTVILSHTKEGLQRGLNAVEEYCDKWQLNINTSKTKVCIFSSRKINPMNTKFKYKGNELEIVEDYKYLGVIFNYNGNFKKNSNSLITQAKKAMYTVISKCRRYNLPIDIQIQLFDSMVLPILLYGAEVWGIKEFKEIEKLHLKFLKHCLGICNSTCNNMVYGELGRFPLEIKIKIRIISYWSNLLNPNTVKLSKRMYQYLLELDQQNTYTSPWISYVKKVLNECGRSDLWINQTTINPQIVKPLITQTLKDQFVQKWRSDLATMSSCDLYNTLKGQFELEKYLRSDIINKSLKTALCKFRCGNTRLPKILGRYNNIPRAQRLCNKCPLSVPGDEYHYLFICTNDDIVTLRQNYLNNYLTPNPNMAHCSNLLKINDTTTIQRLAIFVKKLLLLFQ